MHLNSIQGEICRDVLDLRCKSSTSLTFPPWPSYNRLWTEMTNETLERFPVGAESNRGRDQGTQDRCPVPASSVTAATLDDELVLCDERSGEVFILNVTGARVWSLCDGSRTIEALADLLAAEYQIDDQRALTEVQSLIGDLLDANLITMPPRRDQDMN